MKKQINICLSLLLVLALTQNLTAQQLYPKGIYMSFDEVPYCRIEDWDDEEDTIENQLIDFIKVEHRWHDKITYRKTMTDEEMHKDVMENMEALLEQTFNI